MQFKRNPAFKAEFRKTPRFRGAMIEQTEIVESAIIFAAFPHRDTGNYINRISTRGTRVFLEKHFAHIMEYGTVTQAPQANVRRGVISTGLRFSDDHEHAGTP